MNRNEEDFRLFQLVKQNPIKSCVELSKNMRGKRNGVFYFTESFRIDFEKRMTELEREECTFTRQNEDWVVYMCSNCKEDWCFEDGTPKDNCYNYCPKCGAKIVEVKELEEDES